MTLSDAEVAEAYVELRARVIAILRALDESVGDTVVPHCPQWTVRDLAAHMLGVPDDIINGRMEGVASDAWTQAQVERHRHLSLREMADALQHLAPTFDPMLPHFPPLARSQMVMDAVTHEHDLRHAIGQPGARDSLAVHVGVDWLLQWAEGRVPGSTAALRAARVSDFDLLRCLTGRRSTAQIAELGLSVEFLAAIQRDSPFRPPDTRVVE